MTHHSHIPDQIAHFNVQGIGNDFQRSQGHALPAGFDPVQVDAVQPRQFRKLILSYAFLRASGLDVPADRPLNILQRLQTRAYAALKHPA